MKPLTPTWGSDALIRDEEQTVKSENKELNRERTSSPAILDHSVAFYDQQGLYSEPILYPPPPPAYREKKCI